MTLAEKIWIPISIHRVVWAWLRAERNTNLAGLLTAFPVPDVLWLPGLSQLLDHPNVDNAEENRARLRLLYMVRNVFVVEIPPDTAWFEVRYLSNDNLGELRVVNYGDWTVAEEHNELNRVAARKQIPLGKNPEEWEPPILWGHDRNGPFTILEGNNRLTAYAGSGRTDLNIPVFIGLSPIACVWHILDNCNKFLMQDLIKR